MARRSDRVGASPHLKRRLGREQRGHTKSRGAELSKFHCAYPADRFDRHSGVGDQANIFDSARFDAPSTFRSWLTSLISAQGFLVAASFTPRSSVAIISPSGTAPLRKPTRSSHSVCALLKRPPRPYTAHHACIWC